MKKMTLIGMMALLVMAASCKKDKEQKTYMGESFVATVENEVGDSKTYLDGNVVKWNENDAILITSFNCPEGVVFKTSDKDTDEAEFRFTTPPPSNFYVAPYTAYYPSSAMQGTTLDLPQTQTFANGAFANGANPMAAKSNNNTLKFKNICGFLKLSLKSDKECTVQNITLTAADNEKLWGKGTVSFDTNDNPVLGTLSNGGSSITLDCSGKGVVLNTTTPVDFYFMVPAGTLAKGFTVKVTDTKARSWSKTAPANTDNQIMRSKIRPMPVLTAETKLEGVIGPFSTSSSHKVYFAKGNLYYTPATGIFSFEDEQWKHIPYAGTGENQDWDPTHVSHFFWLSDPVAAAAQTSVATYNGSLFTNDPSNSQLPNANFTANGAKGVWRSLTSDEWNYLLNSRSYTTQMYINSKRVRYAFIMVNDGSKTHKGLLLFPDNFPSWPSGAGTKPSDVNVAWGSDIKTYTVDQFHALENAGCAFLPVGGSRFENSGQTVGNANSSGRYWTSTIASGSNRIRLYFYSGNTPQYSSTNSYGYGNTLRLVVDE